MRAIRLIPTLVLIGGLLAPPTLAQPGALDPSFGDAGVVLIESARFADVDILPDGELVAVGSSYPGDSTGTGAMAAAWRFHPDGAPDVSFGDQGVAILGVEYTYLTSVAPHPDGGSITSLVDESCRMIFDDCHTSYSVERIFEDGTFGESWTTPGGSSVFMQEDGRILHAGTVGPFWAPDAGMCYAKRYLPDGNPDPSFGEDGEVVVEPGPNDDESWTTCGPVAPDESGHLTLATVGGPRVNGSLLTYRWGALRLLADGTVDSSFEPVANVQALNRLVSVAVGPGGRVALGGRDDANHPVLVRFTDEGTLDISFGDGGVAVFDAFGEGVISHLVMQPDGKLLATLATTEASLVRVLSDGSLDPTFGADGIATVAGNVQGLDSAGRIIVTGGGFIARLLNDQFVASEPSVQPDRLRLSTPAPNPASGRTSLSYTLAEPAPVRLAVYDILGREVAVLAKGSQPAGEHEALIDASRLAPGLYVVRLVAGGEVATRRFTVVR